MTWREFLETISQEAPLVMRERVWERSIEPTLLTFLKDHGVLEPGPPAEWYEDCPRASHACPARIIPTVGLRPQPYQAVPPEGHRCCVPRYLSSEDVATLAFNVEGFMRIVRDALAVRGAMHLDASLLSDGVMLSIGHKHVGGAQRAVYYAPSISNWAVVERLRLMKLVGPPALVFVPARGEGMPPDFELEFGGPDRLQVQFLEDVLRWTASGIEAVPTAATPLATPAFARALTREGAVELDEDGYRALVEGRDQYAFFLDAVQVERQRHRALGLGKKREVLLSARAAAVLLEIMEAKEGKEAARLSALSDYRRQDPAKFVEKVRSEVDVTAGGRTTWTMFKTKTSLHGPKRFVFEPPAGLKYAVIRPA